MFFIKTQIYYDVRYLFHLVFKQKIHLRGIKKENMSDIVRRYNRLRYSIQNL